MLDLTVLGQIGLSTIKSQNCTSPIDILNKAVPQIIDLEKIGFGKGFTHYKKIIIISGTPTNQTDQFVINLADDGELFKTADVPFHFNARFDYDDDENVVVRNSWTKSNGWAIEKRSGDFPFEIGQPFVLEFRPYSVKGNMRINIYINNKFFVDYSISNHRFSLYGISQLQITGAIKLNYIKLCGTPPKPALPTCEQPIIFPNVNVPVNYDFVKIGLGLGFLPKKMITIIGTPTYSEEYGPKDFVVNIGEDGVMEKNSSILFSFSPRFDVKEVVRNSWTKEKGWETEERYGPFPFSVGQPFVLEIYAKYNNYIYVDVNYKYFTSFYRHDLAKVSQIEIFRAVQVGSVVFCKKYN